MQNGRVVAYSFAQRQIRVLPAICSDGVSLIKPLAMCICSNQFYITDAVLNCVLVLRNAVWERLEWYGGISRKIHLPGSIAGDAAGNLYLADFLNNRICRIDAGRTISALPIPCEKPYGIYVYQNILYITDTQNQRLLQYDLSGKMLRALIESNISPIAVTADEQGDLYFSEYRKLYLYHVRRKKLELILDQEQWQKYGFDRLCHIGALAATENKIYFSDTIKNGIYEIEIMKEAV